MTRQLRNHLWIGPFFTIFLSFPTCYLVPINSTEGGHLVDWHFKYMTLTQLNNAAAQYIEL